MLSNGFLPQDSFSEDLLAGGERPFVSIIMPIRNEANFIAHSLNAIFAQTYPADHLEIIISDGMSSDNTRQIIQSMARPNVRLIDNPGKIASTGLNAAIRQACGDVIIRIDGHALVEPTYVEECVTWLLKRDVACVGGSVESLGHGFMGEAIALAMSSPFGVGSFGFRTLQADAEPQLTDTVPFGAYRREVFDQIGLFNEKMIRHQDYEFCYRLRQAGGQILLLPHARVTYYVRSSLLALWRQYWQYGLWKGRFLRQHPASLKLRHLLPPLFVLAVGISALASLLFSWSYYILTATLILYNLFIVLAVSIISFKARTLKYSLLLAIVLICLHMSWGAGVWRGLFSRIEKSI